MKVLLVDDSPTMRNIQKNVLAKIGATAIVEAADGAEALAHLRKSRFDLVLTDWDMPKMDGLEFVKAVRAAGIEVFMLMVATRARKAHVLEALLAGVDGYVLKPFSPRTLKAKIKSVTKKQKRRP